ncbi:glycosyltransferase family 4 protein [Rhizobium alvei]|uniref:Glycosyltransferase family 4 protein n=1 Tax=Rhizobium alvei TaxID=1132659 RepID=A0ABT8YGJ3_9HYPH|nr:glycosyltransferase family 4 protein [Rhizobium alvei]MDO6962395.1 glycosyltransferase family 4 protein [Rhizobium alvei]
MPLIVHVVRQFHPSRGGLEDVVANLAREGQKAGYRIRIVTLDSVFSDPGRKLAERETIDGLEVIRIPWRGSSRYPIAPKVLGSIREADLVHVHAIDFFFDFLALTRLFHRKPMIVTTHGGFFHTRRFARIKAIWFQTLTRLSASRYDRVVACSQSDTELFEKIVSRGVACIENGVDTNKFRDASAKSPSKRIVTIGRFSSNKRLDRMISAMAALVRKDPDWHLDIVGVPSDQTVADLETMIAAERISNHVSVHCNLENDAIRTLIGQSSFFASASEYEGFGLVAIEAMSAGLLPVLAENEAYRALAAKHDSISLADYEQPDAVADVFLAQWNGLCAHVDQSRTQAMQQADAYSWSTVAEQYFAIYRSVLGLR